MVRLPQLNQNTSELTRNGVPFPVMNDCVAPEDRVNTGERDLTILVVVREEARPTLLMKLSNQ
jgi:hypothetical protein